jgi:hypothetical protein
MAGLFSFRVEPVVPGSTCGEVRYSPERESVVRVLGADDVHRVLKNRRGAAESGASPV